MQKAEVPPYPVLRAHRPHAIGNGARKFARCDEACRLVRDWRAVLIHEVVAQHEQSVDPKLGLEVQLQRGGREVLAADV